MSGMDQTHQNIPKRSKTVSCLDKCSWFLEQLQDSLVLNSSPSVPAVRLLGLGWHHQGGKLNRTASSCSPHHSHSRLVCHDFSTRSSSSSSSFTCHFSRIEAVSSSLFRSLLTRLTGRCTCCACVPRPKTCAHRAQGCPNGATWRAFENLEVQYHEIQL